MRAYTDWSDGYKSVYYWGNPQKCAEEYQWANQNQAFNSLLNAQNSRNNYWFRSTQAYPMLLPHHTESAFQCCLEPPPPQQRAHHINHLDDYDSNDEETQKEEEKVVNYDIYFNDTAQSHYDINLLTYIYCRFSRQFQSSDKLYNYCLNDYGFDIWSNSHT